MNILHKSQELDTMWWRYKHKLLHMDHSVEDTRSHRSLMYHRTEGDSLMEGIQGILVDIHQTGEDKEDNQTVRDIQTVVEDIQTVVEDIRVVVEDIRTAAVKDIQTVVEDIRAAVEEDIQAAVEGIQVVVEDMLLIESNLLLENLVPVEWKLLLLLLRRRRLRRLRLFSFGLLLPIFSSFVVHLTATVQLLLFLHHPIFSFSLVLRFPISFSFHHLEASTILLAFFYPHQASS